MVAFGRQIPCLYEENFHNFWNFKKTDAELVAFNFEDFSPMFMNVHSTLRIPPCMKMSWHAQTI